MCCNQEHYDSKRLPLGSISISAIRKNNKIYIDKTSLIAKIANKNSPIFFSRPRRFGKTLLINTFGSLFTDGLNNFHGLDIEKIWDDKTYKVIHIDFSAIADGDHEEFKKNFIQILLQQFNAFDLISKYHNFGIPDPNIILNDIAQNLDDCSIVLLIDEYDAPLTHHMHKYDQLQKIIPLLNNFYATVKQFTDKFRFIFITGVTRISHLSIFSAFNNLIDLSLDKEFNTLLGFTQNELVQYFDPYIENAAEILKMSKDDVYKMIKKYYDGFQFSIDANETLYNPWSLLRFFDNPEKGFENYWFQSSGSSSIIMQYAKNSDLFRSFNYQDVDLQINEKDLANRYDITNIPIDILLFQSGYFTLQKKSYKKARLVFPNTEVEDSILQLYLTTKNIDPDIEDYCIIDELIDNIDKKNLDFIINVFNGILNDCVSSDSNIFNDERSIRDIIYAAIPQKINIHKIKERVTVKGRSDLEIITQKTHFIVEFKRTYPSRNAAYSLEEAINQIQNNRYGIGSFKRHTLYRVAMVISTEEKTILSDFCKEVS